MAAFENVELISDIEEVDPSDIESNEQLHIVTSDNLLHKDFIELSEFSMSWVNDLVINSYFDLIVERSKKEGYASVYAFNTFFYTAYRYRGYESVKRWTRKIDIFSYDLNFVPIHMGPHWMLSVIDHRSKKICFYDSMRFSEERYQDMVVEYFGKEYENKKGQVLDPNLYVKEIMEDIPRQMNGSDSGMFLLKYAEYISRDAKITFTQGHMRYFRKIMTQELLQKRLLLPRSSKQEAPPQ